MTRIEKVKLIKAYWGKLSLRKLFNYLLLVFSYHLSFIIKKPIHWGMPFSISIEPTTTCNLGCTECPSGLKSFTRPTGHLNMDLFRNIIDEIHKDLLYLTIYFQGEPLINPNFYEIARYASENRIYTATSTNGHYLTPTACNKIIDSKLDRLIISLDGMDQKTYETYRVGGKYEKVIQGIKNMVEAKSVAAAVHPYIELQFIVFKHNQHQIEEVKKLGKELGVNKVAIKSAQVYDYKNGHDLIPTIDKYSRYRQTKSGTFEIKSKMENKCFRMWTGNVITWDGRIVPCCFDKDAHHQLGQIGVDKSFRSVWKSTEYQKFRKQLLGSRKEIDICKNCTEGMKID